MDIKNLESATIALAEIKQLDSSIIEIEELAFLLIDGKTKSRLTLSVEDLSKASKEESIIDEDGSLIRPGVTAQDMYISMFRPRRSFSFDSNTEKPSNIHSLRIDLTEEFSLQILAVILEQKRQIRRDLLSKLKSFGVNINH